MQPFAQEMSSIALAIQSAVATASVSGAIMPVRDVAERIVEDSQCDPAMFGIIVDALCSQCIRKGVIIEFQAPPEPKFA